MLVFYFKINKFYVFFEVLLRAYPIETGKILLDGDALDTIEMDPRVVRSIFGFVSQTPFIFRLLIKNLKTIKKFFSGTIRENLTMNSKALVTDEEILSIIIEAKLGMF